MFHVLVLLIITYYIKSKPKIKPDKQAKKIWRGPRKTLEGQPHHHQKTSFAFKMKGFRLSLGVTLFTSLFI